LLKVLKKTTSHQITIIGLAKFEASMIIGNRDMMCRRMQRGHLIVASTRQMMIMNGSNTTVRSK